MRELIYSKMYECPIAFAIHKLQDGKLTKLKVVEVFYPFMYLGRKTIKVRKDSSNRFEMIHVLAGDTAGYLVECLECFYETNTRLSEEFVESVEEPVTMDVQVVINGNPCVIKARPEAKMWYFREQLVKRVFDDPSLPISMSWELRNKHGRLVDANDAKTNMNLQGYLELYPDSIPFYFNSGIGHGG